MQKNRKIVFIMTDTQRHDMVGCYGNKEMRTPCLDKMAEEGIRFDKAYTTQPVCQPARAGIFTGMFPHSSGSWTNSVAIGDNVRTVGKRLQDEGVHTAYIGKWHLDGSDYFGLGICPDGWDKDYWYDMRNYLDEMTEEERFISRQSDKMKTRDFPSDYTYGHKCTDKAIDFLQKHSSEDFFLSVSYDEPHDPSICPREFWEPFENYEFPKSKNVWDTLEGKPDYQKVWAGRALDVDRDKVSMRFPFLLGCNSYIDSQIGRVIDAVEKYAPDALIIYTSDHGDFMNSHCLFAKGPAAYEEITHIPFIVKGKDIPKGIVNSNPISHINIAPTIFELMGVERPEVFEGKSILPEFIGGDRVNDQIFIEFGRYEVDHDGFGGFQPMRSCYDGRYKLSLNLLSSDELYDLENDPEEMKNLIEDEEYADIRNSLHDAILNNMNITRDPFRGYHWEQRPWRKDASKPTWSYTLMTRQRIDDKYERRQLNYSTGLEITEGTRVK